MTQQNELDKPTMEFLYENIDINSEVQQDNNVELNLNSIVSVSDSKNSNSKHHRVFINRQHSSTNSDKTSRSQSFTSLMADFRQDINRVSPFSRSGALMEHFLERITPLRHWYIYPNDKYNKYRALPSRRLLNAKLPLMFW